MHAQENNKFSEGYLCILYNFYILKLYTYTYTYMCI